MGESDDANCIIGQVLVYELCRAFTYEEVELFGAHKLIITREIIIYTNIGKKYVMHRVFLVPHTNI